MRALIAGPDALRDEGIAQVVRGLLTGVEVDRVGKHELLARAAEGASPALAIVAYPWISLATLRALQQRHPAVAIVAITGGADAGTEERLLAQRVAAIVPEWLPADIVAAALRAVLCGSVSVRARSSRETASVHAPLRVRTDALNLTPRQFDVLALLASGRSNDAIAAKLGIGVRTVKGHVAVILRALHSDNRRDARRVARRWLKRMATGTGTGPSVTKAGIG
jgi:DNA-binding NarL/FixJ family response regulator